MRNVPAKWERCASFWEFKGTSMKTPAGIATMILLSMTLTVGCSRQTTFPVMAEDERVCASCGMLVSDLAYAGVIRMVNGTEQTFDDPVCLINFVRQGKGEAAARIWFHDYAGDLWIDASSVTFLQQKRSSGPMGGGIAAYGKRALALRDAGAMGARSTSSYSELVRAKGPLS